VIAVPFPGSFIFGSLSGKDKAGAQGKGKYGAHHIMYPLVKEVFIIILKAEIPWI
jgi:hypothetical protein